MWGVEVLGLERYTDTRGSLLAFGADSPIPFDVKNIYFIVDCPRGAVRAEHATASDLAIVALSSSVTVDVDNGSERGIHRLSDPDTVLVVRAGVWLRLHGFREETRLAVLSSKTYDQITHYDAPVPALLGVPEA